MNEDSLEDKIGKMKREAIGRMTEIVDKEKLKDKFRNIYDNIYVRAGETLAINAGSVWKFVEGKGIYVQGGTLKILGTKEEPVVLQARNATWYGIYIENSALENLMQYTTIKQASKDNGGGIFASKSSLFITYSTITNCEAKWHGGGIDTWKSNVKIDNSEIKHNKAEWGAGMSNRNYSELIVQHTAITNNAARMNGGGIAIFNGSEVQIANSNILNNNADSEKEFTYMISGGGIYTIHSNVTLKQSRIAKNTSRNGGGIHNINSNVYLIGQKQVVYNSPNNITESNE